MVNVSHDSHNRCTRLQILFCIRLLFNGLSHFSADIFSLVTKLFGYQIDGFCIQTLVDRYHDTDTHTSRDNLCHGNIHHACQFVCSNELGQLQYLAFFLFQFLLFQLTVLDRLTFFLTVLSRLVLTLVGQTSQGFLHLLSYILIAHLRFHYRLLQAVLTVLIIRFATLVSAWSIVTSTVIAGSTDIYPFLIDTVAFLLSTLTGSILVTPVITLADFLDDGILHLLPLLLTLLVLFFSFLTLFLLRFLLRTRRLVQGSQVNLAYHINFRLKFGRTNFKNFTFLILLGLCFLGLFLFFHHL